MLTKADRAGKYKAIETLRNCRVTNLRKLMEAFGSWAALGRACGYNASFLVAIAGPNPRRTVGEKLARDLEVALKLKQGFLDVAH